MKKIFLLSAIFYLSMGMLYAGSVEAKVSSEEVIKGNSVQLYLEAKGDDVEFPQIETIDGNMVEGTSIQSSSNFTYINGDLKSEKTTTKVILFTPRKDMRIPSYKVMVDGKNYQTDPIKIKVIASKAPQLKKDSLYSFEIKSDKKEMTVGDTLILKLYVSISDEIQGAKLADFVDPTTDGFFSKALGEPKQYRQNGSTVVEKQYLLTANKEGNLTIGAATAKLGEADLRRRDFFGRYATQWYDIASNDLKIEVKSQPKKSDLIGDFYVQTSIDTTEVEANKPVNLTVKIEGKGNLEDFEFPKYEIAGVSVFPNEAKIESKVVDGTIYSTFTQSFAMISDKDFIIPAKSFTTYDSTTSTLKTLKTDVYDIKVKEDKTALTAVIPSAVKPESVQPMSKEEGKVTEKSGIQTERTIEWWMLAVAFASGMVLMYLLMLLPKLGSRKKTYSNDEALQVLYPHINENKDVEEMVRKLYARKNGDKSVMIDKQELKALVEKMKKA